jgi:hypothetical protein
MTALASRSYAWAGLVAGPGAWAIGTQVKYSYVSLACADHPVLVTVGITLLSAILAVLGGVISWRAWKTFREAERVVPPDGREAREFLAAISILMAALFTAVILVQGAAGFVFHGCEL